MSYISFDSSTSSTTVVVFDDNLNVVKRFQKEHKQIYTPEGYVEHDLNEIYENLIELMGQVSKIVPDPKFISFTNQRETFVIFDTLSGKPLHNAVVWQCRRGQKVCDQINKSNKNRILLKKTTGLHSILIFLRQS